MDLSSNIRRAFNFVNAWNVYLHKMYSVVFIQIVFSLFLSAAPQNELWWRQDDAPSSVGAICYKEKNKRLKKSIKKKQTINFYNVNYCCYFTNESMSLWTSNCETVENLNKRRRKWSRQIPFALNWNKQWKLLGITLEKYKVGKQAWHDF